MKYPIFFMIVITLQATATQDQLQTNITRHFVPAELYNTKKPKKPHNYRKLLSIRDLKDLPNKYNAKETIINLMTVPELELFQKPYTALFINPYALSCFLQIKLPHSFESRATKRHSPVHNGIIECAETLGLSYPLIAQQRIENVMQQLSKEPDYKALRKHALAAFHKMSWIEQVQFIWYLAKEEDRLVQLRNQKMYNQLSKIVGSLVRCDLITALNISLETDESRRHADWHKLTEHFTENLLPKMVAQ